ncbi:hypothetical protein G7061_08310 [Erysipelothrix sp. HDW6B]|uniref:AIPR family protein n=1 Tax=Erysipelothrix sp. HDW6B TaxID=2714929 RepID=UPI00140B0ACD|nr:AIPR family protein [Erysipelothrix sp. HDW6B]QIK86610.1 hypothetical protein G7061_08310 [Erysipelothrix sp. HDW6B]
MKISYVKEYFEAIKKEYPFYFNKFNSNVDVEVSEDDGPGFKMFFLRSNDLTLKNEIEEKIFVCVFDTNTEIDEDFDITSNVMEWIKKKTKTLSVNDQTVNFIIFTRDYESYKTINLLLAKSTSRKRTQIKLVYYPLPESKADESNYVRLKVMNSYNRIEIFNNYTDNGIVGGFVYNVSLFSLFSLYKEYGQKLFEKNVRAGLKNENKAITRTLDDDEDIKNFWFYNNGVTLTVSNHLIFSNDEILLSKPRVLNGAQTIHTIFQKELMNEHHGLKENAHYLEEASVLVRIIELDTSTDSTSLSERKITNYLNNQSPIRAQDQVSNSELMIYVISEMNRYLDDSLEIYAVREADEENIRTTMMSLRYSTIVRLYMAGISNSPGKYKRQDFNKSFIDFSEQWIDSDYYVNEISDDEKKDPLTFVLISNPEYKKQEELKLSILHSSICFFLYSSLEDILGVDHISQTDYSRGEFYYVIFIAHYLQFEMLQKYNSIEKAITKIADLTRDEIYEAFNFVHDKILKSFTYRSIGETNLYHEDLLSSELIAIIFLKWSEMDFDDNQIASYYKNIFNSNVITKKNVGFIVDDIMKTKELKIDENDKNVLTDFNRIVNDVNRNLDLYYDEKQGKIFIISLTVQLTSGSTSRKIDSSADDMNLIIERINKEVDFSTIDVKLIDFIYIYNTEISDVVKRFKKLEEKSIQDDLISKVLFERKFIGLSLKGGSIEEITEKIGVLLLQ